MNFKALIEAYKVQVALCRNPDSGIREIFACGIRNLENSSRNPDSTSNWNPESKSDKNPDSNIRIRVATGFCSLFCQMSNHQFRRFSHNFKILV